MSVTNANILRNWVIYKPVNHLFQSADVMKVNPIIPAFSEMFGFLSKSGLDKINNLSKLRLSGSLKAVYFFSKPSEFGYSYCQRNLLATPLLRR